MKRLLFPCLLAALVLASCEKTPEDKPERGYIISTREIKTYTPQDIKDFLQINDFEVPFTLTYDVKAVKIAYQTPRPDGALENATGAVFIPQTDGEFPVISFQHGTQTQRYLVPSMGIGNSEAGLAGAVAASMGYVCLAADYLGLGESFIVPPYLLAENSATTVIDLLRAGNKYLEQNGVATDGSLYLTGYSQGGHVSLATLNEIEQNYTDEFTVTACAPLAGPFDLAGTIDTIMGWGEYEEPILFAYLMNCYDFYYKWDRLDEIFQEPYASQAPTYFDGSQLLSSLRTRLPKDLESLLTQEFISGYSSGGEQDFKTAIGENSLLGYVPSAPVMLIHSVADSTVPYFNSETLLEYYNSMGKTNVELTSINGEHEPAAEAAILGAMSWFESLRQK